MFLANVGWIQDGWVKVGRKKIGRIMAASLVVWSVSACDSAVPTKIDAEREDTNSLSIGSVILTNPRVMQPLPGKTISSGYFDLTNNGTVPISLVGASSPLASSIEIHEILRDGDKVRMRRVPEIIIAPGATESFARGGLHLMLFGIKPFANDAVQVELMRANGDSIQAPFRVERW